MTPKPAVLGVLLGLLAVSIQSSVVLADRVVVVAHPSVTATSLSESALRAIFGMRLRTWPDGSAIRVFVLPDQAPLNGLFSKKILGVFPHQIRRSWDRLVFSGAGQAPTEVASEPAMLDSVATTPGGIGYLREESVDRSVRVLTVEELPVE